MTDTIRRWECPECGRRWDPGDRPKKKHYAGGELCPGVPVERVYVATDALLSDEAAMSGCKNEGMFESRKGVIRAAIAAATGGQA